ncbi:cytochrome P450 6k1-like [Chrysoperla carnea]|uniref:cytochrome P450 6k1-like n=1 Tax=Chrysoperla carnea TaxID=189513 RepID=UPI001D086AC0|nr:cytochrome P450 6k1-like [Chrysoperla carnea]
MAIITSNWNTDLLTLLAVILTIIYFYFKSTFNYWKKRGVPYAEPNWIFGNFYDAITFKKNITSYFCEQYHKTDEKAYGLYIFQRPYLLLRDPELIKHVLVKDFSNFIPRTSADVKGDEIGRHNMFSMKSVSGWRYIRSKLSPFFTSGKMKNMFGLLDQIGDQLTQQVKSHVKETLDAKEIARLYTTDVIVSTAYGIEVNSFSDKESVFSKVGKMMITFDLRRSLEFLCIFFCPIMVKIFNFKLFSKVGSDFLRNVVTNAMAEREANNIKRPDLIEALITLKNKGTLEDSNKTADTVANGNNLKNDLPPFKLEGDILVAQAAVFFTAGFETTSSAISFTLYSLSYNPEIQIKLRKEIQAVIARNGGNFTYDCLKDMKYLDACVKETLRLYPTLGFLDREALDTYTFPGTNITIDKGTAVVISLEGLHRDPQYFENPLVYDPERFIEDKNIVPYTYMPFGEGPRNCIGARFGMMSTKVGLVHILKDFEVLTQKTAPPLEIDNKGFLLTAKNGINLKFVPGTVYTE